MGHGTSLTFWCMHVCMYASLTYVILVRIDLYILKNWRTGGGVPLPGSDVPVLWWGLDLYSYNAVPIYYKQVGYAANKVHVGWLGFECRGTPAGPALIGASSPYI